MENARGEREEPMAEDPAELDGPPGVFNIGGAGALEAVIEDMIVRAGRTLESPASVCQ